jgi:hypothetical protein
MDFEDDEEFRIKDFVLIIIVIILLILCILTSFRTGQKYFELSHAGFGNSQSNVNSDVAKFYFDARLIVNDNLERKKEYEEYYNND